MEMKIELKFVQTKIAGPGWSANIVGTKEGEWFSKFCKSEEEAEKAIASISGLEGSTLAIEYEENQKGDRVFKKWVDFELVDMVREKPTTQTITDKRAARINDWFERLTDAAEAWKLFKGVERDDYQDRDCEAVVNIARNMGHSK